MSDIYSTDIVDFVPAVNAAIEIDGITIVRDPDSGALVSIAPGPITVEPESDPSYVAPHTHEAEDVTDFNASARAALSPGETNNHFFINTAVSNAVVFTYNKTLFTVSADVKIDNVSIIKNKYGQLTAVQQVVTIDDIEGLDEYIDARIAAYLSDS